MSHPTDWRCRSDSCRTLLGHVRDGVLRPLAWAESIDGSGVARVLCPTCGRARPWFPSAAAVDAAGDRRPPDRPG